MLRARKWQLEETGLSATEVDICECVRCHKLYWKERENRKC